MSVYEKLMMVQSELKAPKGQMNKFGGYKYRSCEDILEAVKPLLTKNKAVIIVGDSVETVGDTRVYIKATAAFVDVETGEKVDNTAYAREEDSKKGMDSSQITGAASSYARKYALNGLLCIDDTKDSDATNTHGKNEPKKDERVNEGELKTLVLAYINRHKMSKEKVDVICRRYGVEKITDLTGPMCEDYIKQMSEAGGNIKD